MMKIKNSILSIVLGLVAVTGYVHANSSEPLVFTSEPTIPSSMPTNGTPACYPYVIKNKLSTDTLPLIISLEPNTDPRISINYTDVPNVCPATDCTDELKAGHSCTIIVKVNPSADTTPSQTTETLTIEYSPRNGALESDIIIDFVLPPPAVLNFSVLPDPPAQVTVGADPIEFTYTIQNIGEQTATDIVPFIHQRQPDADNCLPSLVEFQSSTCEDDQGNPNDQPYVLEPNATCDITLTVDAPDDVPSCDLNVQNEYTLQISYDGVGSPLQSNIDFFVVEAQSAAFLNFESFPDNLPAAVIQGQVSNTYTYVIENYGTVSANIGTITNTTNPVPGSPIVVLPVPAADQCSGTILAPDATCSITYELDATSNPTVRNYTNILSIPYDNPMTSPLQTSYGFAVVTSAPILSLTLTSGPISPIEIPNQETVTFTLDNSGNADATNLNPTIDTNYGFIALTGGTCPNTPNFTLPAGSNCTLEYTITPIVVGTSNQQLQVTYEVTPGNPATVSGDIEFYAYTSTPNNAYVAYVDIVGGDSGHVRECPINLDGSLASCGSPVPVAGVSSLDFTGNYAFTSAYLKVFNFFSVSDKVQKCTASVFGNCHTTASVLNPNASYGSFIKFYSPTLAYLSDFVGAPLVTSASDSVQLCTVSTSTTNGSISCNNAWGSHTISGPTAIGLLKFNSTQQYAYVLNKSNDALLLCTINSPSGTFSNCVDAGTANLFKLSGTLDFISAGDLYAYVPLQVTNNQVEILECHVNGTPSLGTISNCTSVKSIIDTNKLAVVVTAIKVVSVGGSSGNPVVYIGYSDGAINKAISCDVMPDGIIENCSAPTLFNAPIQAINAK